MPRISRECSSPGMVSPKLGVYRGCMGKYPGYMGKYLGYMGKYLGYMGKYLGYMGKSQVNAARPAKLSAGGQVLWEVKW